MSKPAAHWEALWEQARRQFSLRPDHDMEAHARLVVELTRELAARGEPGDLEIAQAAAVLHDVGIPQAIRLYSSGGPPGQEVEGTLLAREILCQLGEPAGSLEAICGIIAVHHHRPDHPTAEFRLVHDADLIVNAIEDRGGYPEIAGRLYSDAARSLARERLG